MDGLAFSVFLSPGCIGSDNLFQGHHAVHGRGGREEGERRERGGRGGEEGVVLNGFPQAAQCSITK